MQANRRTLRRFLAALLILASYAAFEESAPSSTLVDRAQQQVVDYISELADLHCTGDVLQQKLKPNGKTELSERSQYDHFLLMQGDSDAFQLSESRLPIVSARSQHASMLLTNGFSTLSLIFHPYYRSGFNFTPGPPELLNGRSVVPVHFVHRSGARTLAALALRGREFPLELQGTAWLDTHTGQVVPIDATLLHSMADLDLRSLNVDDEYAPLQKGYVSLMVPSKSVVDLETPRQHWRNTHVFRDYKFFSTDVEQDPHVKVRADEVKGEPNTPAHSTSDKKEKP